MVAQRGNILFLILLAVVLFAALSYAVTGSQNGGSKNASEEKMRTDAAAILNYAQGVRTAVGRMRLSNGCTDEQISFDYNNSSTTCLTSETPLSGYENVNSPTDCRCHVFHPLGGGIPWVAPGQMPHAKYGGVYANLYGGTSGIKELGTDNSDLYLINTVSYPTGVPTDNARQFCKIYNEVAGNANADINTLMWGLNGSKFNGSNYNVNGVVAVPQIKGKAAACYRYMDDNNYTFYFVLLER